MKPNKHNFSKIDKYNLPELCSLVDSKTISSIKPKFEDIIGNETDLAEVRLNYNNSWDRKANGLTPDARKSYLEADKTYHRLTNTNITIHVSKRDVFKQAELYIKFTYYGEGSPVAWPGCSLHNWGLAVDVARSKDPILATALNEQGWIQTDDNNEWHFECTGSRDYEKAAKVIKSFRNTKTGLAYKWSDQVAKYYKKRETLNKRAPVFNKRLEVNKAESQRLLAEIENFNIDAQNLKSTTNSFNKDITKFNLELAKAEKLQDEIVAEIDYKIKTKKNDQYEQICLWMEDENLRINNETKVVNKTNKDLQDKKLRLQQRIANYLREDDWLTIESRVLEKLAKEIELHKSNATMHLMGIDSQTWK